MEGTIRNHTLGFVAEAVYKTYHLPARTTVAWLPFDTIDAAVDRSEPWWNSEPRQWS